uniref:Uncharacterized protein n=1 Tax=Arundo donax TaxID=35708 RepID=A0A0A9EGY0_ARUDO
MLGPVFTAEMHMHGRHTATPLIVICIGNGHVETDVSIELGAFPNMAHWDWVCGYVSPSVFVCYALEVPN